MSDLKLYAQPYDIEANGFSFSTMEEYEKKAKKNKNRFGQQVEEYEFQFIDGIDFDRGQEVLDALGLEKFMEVNDTWMKDEIEMLELFIHFEGAQSLKDDLGEIEDQLQDCIVRTDDSEISLYYGLFEDYFPELEKSLRDLGALDYFDEKAYVESSMAGSFERIDGKGYVYFENPN